MKKRGLVIGSFDTAAEGMTMTALKIAEPDVRTDKREVAGFSGALDYSEYFGAPIFDNRTLEATFELSKGNHDSREETIKRMTSALHGQKLKIFQPDRAGEYLLGRVSVKKDFNNLAYAQISISADCEPWYYGMVRKRCEVKYLPNSKNSWSAAALTLQKMEGSSWGALDAGGRLSHNAATGQELCVKIALTANTTYIVAARAMSKSCKWYITLSADGEKVDGQIVRTGADGYIYLHMISLITGAAVLTPIAIAKIEDITTLQNGDRPASPEIAWPEVTSGCWLAIGTRIYDVTAPVLAQVRLPKGATTAFSMGLEKEPPVLSWTEGRL